MKDDSKYWVTVVSGSIMPTVSLHLLIRPQWYLEVSNFTTATEIEMLFTMIALPVYLTIFNYFVTIKYSRNSFIVNGLLILACIIISERMHFANWASSIGNWDHPDGETIMVGNFERGVGIIVSLIGIGICFWKLKRKMYRERTIS